MTNRRDLLIVSIDRRDIYELLKKDLGDRFEVIFDRRRGERRSLLSTTGENRRHGERRSSDESYLVKTVGVIRVPAERRVVGRPRRHVPPTRSSKAHGTRPNDAR